MRTNYPETMAYLKAKRARNPRDDCIEDYTQWTLLGETIPAQPHIPRPGEEPPPKVLALSVPRTRLMARLELPLTS